MDSEELAIYKNEMRRRRALHQDAMKMMAQALGKYDVYVQTHAANKDGYVNKEMARIVEVILTEKYIKPFYKDVMPFIYKTNNIDIYIFSPPPHYKYFEQWVNSKGMKPGKTLDMNWLLTKRHSEFPPAYPYDFWWETQFSQRIMKKEQ